MIYQNLGQFLKENSQKYKERIAYEIKRGFRTQRFTFDNVYDLSLKTASFLASKGLKKGDNVAIWAPNMPEYPILYFGCWLLGVVAVPIDVRTTQETVKVFLTKAKCKLGFKGKFIPGTFGKLVDESFYLEDLSEHLKGVNLITPERCKPDDLAEIAFTSGTTGTPKGVMLTHGNFLSDVDSLTAVFPFQKDWKALSLLPLSHAFEQVVDFLALFKEGIKVIYLERTNRLTIVGALRKNQITSVVLVPQVLQLLINGIESEVGRLGKVKQFKLANQIAPYLPIFFRRLLFKKVHQNLGGALKFFGSGSAPLDVKLIKKWQALGIEIFEGYGATETTAALTINTPQAKRLGSVGKILPGMEVRINPQSQEIEAKGLNISPGYFEDEAKSKTAFYDGWYKTGDVGQFDKDGYLYITGREAFRIVLPNGQKVYPEDLEKKLNSHPQVLQSCVVGIKRDQGEVVHASVITDYPQNLDSIIKDVNAKLASHEQIMEWSLWKEEDFPRTPILKLDRRKVAESVSLAKKPDEPLKIRTQDKLISLLSQVTKANPQEIQDRAILSSDLKLDSLGRVELLSLIEQEFAVAISETKITHQTKVSDLRKLVDSSPTTEDEMEIDRINYQPFWKTLRLSLQDLLVFPLHNLFVPLEVYGKENLKNLSLPVIFYFNHIGVMDGICILRVLPKNIRENLVIVANVRLWKEWRRFFVESIGGGIPFDNQQKIKASLQLVGEFLDDGFSMLLAPEGEFTKDGKLLKFKPGIGFITTQMQVPVVPIKIDPSYLEIFPPMEGKFAENIPKKRKKIWVKIGKPMTFKKDTSYKEATTKMQQALENL